MFQNAQSYEQLSQQLKDGNDAVVLVKEVSPKTLINLVVRKYLMWLNLPLIAEFQDKRYLMCDSRFSG